MPSTFDDDDYSISEPMWEYSNLPKEFVSAYNHMMHLRNYQSVNLQDETDYQLDIYDWNFRILGRCGNLSFKKLDNRIG